MTPDTQQEHESQKSPAEVEIVGHKDGFLQTLVNLVNGGSMRFNLTLVVGGLVITGNLIPGDEYYEKFGKLYAEAVRSYAANGGVVINSGEDDEAIRGIQESFSSFGARYKEEREDDSIERASTEYIHMDNCRLSNVTSHANFDTIWRGRISEVSGFFLGGFTPSK